MRWTGRSKEVDDSGGAREVDGMGGSREVDGGPSKVRGELKPPSMGEREGMESDEVEGK